MSQQGAHVCQRDHYRTLFTPRAAAATLMKAPVSHFLVTQQIKSHVMWWWSYMDLMAIDILVLYYLRALSLLLLVLEDSFNSFIHFTLVEI